MVLDHSGQSRLIPHPENSDFLRQKKAYDIDAKAETQKIKEQTFDDAPGGICILLQQSIKVKKFVSAYIHIIDIIIFDVIRICDAH